MASLQISPPIAFLKTEQNLLSPVPVLRWDITGEPAVYFWYKKNNKGRWRAAIYDTDPDVPHKFSDPTDSSELGQRNGNRDKEWGPGRYVFVAFTDSILNPNDNPNLDDPTPLFRLNFVILRDSTTLLQDTPEDWGSTGTQINAYAHGVPNAKPTFAVLRVDTMEPQRPGGTVTGAAGGAPYPPSWLDFPRLDPGAPGYVAPITAPRPTSQQDLAPTHVPITVASKYFLPGQSYWALLLVYTENGEWQVKKGRVKMMRRIVEITFREISIDNDGAYGEGKAYFHWWVVDRDLVAKSYRTGTIPIHDQPVPGEEWKEHIGLSTYIPEEDTPLRLGPHEVSEDKFNRCLILTRAIGKHTTGTDDKSGNVKVELTVGTVPPEGEILEGAGLEFPIGADKERFEGKRFFMEAANVNDDDDSNEFRYTIRGLYSVDYEP